MNIINKVTLKALWKNKVRTIVTIIGIILSVSMITAVTTIISSLQNYLLELFIEQDGDWHGNASGIPYDKLAELAEDPEIESMTTIQNIGYSFLEESRNKYKPYLFIAGMDGRFASTMPVKLTTGRLPENPSEIILPAHLETNGGVKYSAGDVLELDIGIREYDGAYLDQNVPLMGPDGGESERFTVKERRIYTVVGFYERPSFEPFSAPGYTALTIDDGEKTYTYDVYLKVRHPRELYDFMDETFYGYKRTINNDYLRLLGISNMGSFLGVFYGLGAILIGIIMFGSISLIYNAFSISVSERTKQFGILSSVGATKRQLMRGVLFEAFTLSTAGIPLGILAGILGIGVTFKFTEGLFSSLFGGSTKAVLHLHVTWQAIVIAAVIGFVTVLISAYIPARRAKNVSAIDAIRMTRDVRIEARKVRTSGLIYKLFGFEGMLARKNFKRNRKKYRATVVSLFISIVLFVSASSFSSYLKKGTGAVIDPAEYDIIFTYTPDTAEKYTLNEIFDSLSNVNGVTESGYAVMNSLYHPEIDAGNLSDEYLEFSRKSYNQDLKEGEYTYIYVMQYFINDEVFRRFLEENSMDIDFIMDPNNPRPVVYDYVKLFHYQEEKYYTMELIKKDVKTINMTKMASMDGLFFSREEEKNGRTQYIYTDDYGNEMEFPAQKALMDHSIEVGALTAKKPFMVVTNQGRHISLLYPYSAAHKVLGEDFGYSTVQMFFKTKNHSAVYEKMLKVLSTMGLGTGELYDYAESLESSRAIITVIDVFSYGFIVLISLIAAANVFNTISTNIGLRRREFAMLKSIGMTQKMFNKMMNYECLLYGIKGLLYGLPVSIGVTYLIYQSIKSGLETTFFIPWYSIAIAVGSVFLVVFATMLYSMDKIRKDNPIDALKEENL